MHGIGNGTLRKFGSTGPMVAAVGQGSWRSDEAHTAAAIASLRRGLDLGMTHIDTAEMYGSGAAETLIGARRCARWHWLSCCGTRTRS